MKQPLEIMTELGLSDVNPGASTGAGWWSSLSIESRLDSRNPATGEVIAWVTPPIGYGVSTRAAILFSRSACP